jgi:hypothetical protein
MYITTKRELIDTVAERWRNLRYSDGWIGPEPMKHHSERVHNELVKLPPDATESQVTAILGNSSWTRNTCNECGKDSEVLIIIGEHNRNTGEHTAWVCVDCLKKAVVLAESTIEVMNGER